MGYAVSKTVFPAIPMRKDTPKMAELEGRAPWSSEFRAGFLGRTIDAGNLEGGGDTDAFTRNGFLNVSWRAAEICNVPGPARGTGTVSKNDNNCV